jgi:hypothetical protein
LFSFVLCHLFDHGITGPEELGYLKPCLGLSLAVYLHPGLHVFFYEEVVDLTISGTIGPYKAYITAARAAEDIGTSGAKDSHVLMLAVKLMELHHLSVRVKVKVLV